MIKWIKFKILNWWYNVTSKPLKITFLTDNATMKDIAIEGHYSSIYFSGNMDLIDSIIGDVNVGIESKKDENYNRGNIKFCLFHGGKPKSRKEINSKK